MPRHKEPRRLAAVNLRVLELANEEDALDSCTVRVKNVRLPLPRLFELRMTRKDACRPESSRRRDMVY